MHSLDLMHQGYGYLQGMSKLGPPSAHTGMQNVGLIRVKEPSTLPAPKFNRDPLELSRPAPEYKQTVPLMSDQQIARDHSAAKRRRTCQLQEESKIEKYPVGRYLYYDRDDPREANYTWPKSKPVSGYLPAPTEISPLTPEQRHARDQAAAKRRRTCQQIKKSETELCLEKHPVEQGHYLYYDPREHNYIWPK